MKRDIYTVAVALSAALALGAGCTGGMGDGSSGSKDGSQGGSMARFTVSGDVLYTVSDTHLRVLKIDEPELIGDKSKEMDNRPLNANDAETIFTMDKLLFIGSKTAMTICDISMPHYPKIISRTNHFHSCDPVTAWGNLAFVTLNGTSGVWCGITGNSLIVYDITDVKDGIKPKKISEETSLSSPGGVGVDGDEKIVFVCDGDMGVRAFDFSEIAADPGALPAKRVELLFHTKSAPGLGSLDAYDCIVRGGKTLVVTGDDGLYQMRYERFEHPDKNGEKGAFTKLSQIEIKREE